MCLFHSYFLFSYFLILFLTLFHTKNVTDCQNSRTCRKNCMKDSFWQFFNAWRMNGCYTFFEDWYNNNKNHLILHNTIWLFKTMGKWIVLDPRLRSGSLHHKGCPFAWTSRIGCSALQRLANRKELLSSPFLSFMT